MPAGAATPDSAAVPQAADASFTADRTPAAGGAAYSASGDARLQDAIGRATEEGRFDPDEPPGVLGVPGGPQISPWCAFAWVLWVGWIFSTVGAFGGVMASIGHISVFGLGDWATSFGSSPLNRLATDSIRAHSLCMIGVSALTASFRHGRLGRIVLPLGLALGLGALGGAVLASILSLDRLLVRDYMGWFGIFVLALAAYLFWQTLPRTRERRRKALEAARAFESRTAPQDSRAGSPVTLISAGLSRVRFASAASSSPSPPFRRQLPALPSGAHPPFSASAEASSSSPLLAGAFQLPMHLAAGTSAFAILIGTASASVAFMFGGAPVDWPLLGVVLAGVAAGSWIGPMTSRFISGLWLKRLFSAICLVAGANCVLHGFFGMRFWQATRRSV
ncbi:MAG: sulfite exporter TauE/SafE family protein [Desulfovibrio sp.]|nr:sulfite exporter TauE/SafE family protein [Desulfovibrio sp.]